MQRVVPEDQKRGEETDTWGRWVLGAGVAGWKRQKDEKGEQGTRTSDRLPGCVHGPASVVAPATGMLERRSARWPIARGQSDPLKFLSRHPANTCELRQVDDSYPSSWDVSQNATTAAPRRWISHATTNHPIRGKVWEEMWAAVAGWPLGPVRGRPPSGPLASRIAVAFPRPGPHEAHCDDDARPQRDSFSPPPPRKIASQGLSHDHANQSPAENRLRSLRPLHCRRTKMLPHRKTVKRNSLARIISLSIIPSPACPSRRRPNSTSKQAGPPALDTRETRGSIADESCLMRRAIVVPIDRALGSLLRLS
ncbi:hypothetical protein DHEL01_v202128 [Diaporthe helianthi]|uniref:Uncharacterized protein n=1 Tax=Diaporthe helianthi TaxID=158607 RepID=A0A2P5IAI4_DIAHE|nr:hypothetical protein DHEL01_v202128 [Diaporthe helianthi]